MSIIGNVFKSIKSITGNRFLILCDQTFFSLFNFASIFLLSKIAPFEVFSSFVLFQSYIFFIFIFTTFLLAAPCLVLLNKYWKDKKEVYLSVLLWSNFIFSFFLSLICFFFLHEQGVKVHFALVFGVPLLMATFDIIKKYFFSSFSIKLYHAIISSSLLSLVFFSGIYINQGVLTLDVIIKLYLLSYAFAVFYLVCVLLFSRVISLDSFKFLKHFTFIKVVLSKHYVYSKWIILGGIAFWGYSHGLYIFAEEMLVSDFGISKVKTAHNILGVVNILVISVENYYTPVFSKFIAGRPQASIRTLVIDLYKKYTLVVCSVMIAIFICAVLFYQILYEVKYGNGFILIILFTASQLILFLIRPVIIALKSLEITFPFFNAHIFALLTMLIAGYFIIDTYAYTGMAITYFLSMIVFVITVYYYYSKKVKSLLQKS